MFGDFKGRAKRIDDIDLPRVAHRIGVGEDELHAILEVEASGSGFDKQGRPKMLFEPHVFYRNLTGLKRDTAVKQGLARRTWKVNGKVPKYPKDSYPRLIQAMQIDETAALRSASWGLGQILGENHKAVGYPTVQAMVLDFMDDEENHLDAIVEFIVTQGLDDEVQRHDWAGFARGYNGPAYATHGYHTKLAKAYAKWAKIKDTPWSPEMDAPKPEPKPAPAPVPHMPAPQPDVSVGAAASYLAILIAGATAAAAWVLNLPCETLGLWCN